MEGTGLGGTQCEGAKAVAGRNRGGEEVGVNAAAFMHTFRAR